MIENAETNDRVAHSAKRDRRTSRLVMVGILLIITSRVLSLSLPLIVTNDGTEYLAWAQSIVAHLEYPIPALRTPGYPWFLAAAFEIFGIGPVGVLLSQHVLGVLICLFPFLVGRSLKHPRIGLLVSILLAIDPFVFAIETFALTETLTMFLVCSAAWIVIVKPFGRWDGPLLGIVLGLGCLTRPAVQSIAPFFILGWAISEFGWSRRCIRAYLVCGITMFATLSPWLYFNAKRNIWGLSHGFGTFQWIGLASQGLLDHAAAPDPVLREKFDALGEKKSSPGDLVLFVLSNDGFGVNASTFNAWARDGVFRNPARYFWKVAKCTLWQLNYFPSPTGGELGEVTWFIARASEDGSNNQFEGEFKGSSISLFESYSAGGPIRAALRIARSYAIPGVPQVPLFGLSLVVIPIAISRRRWDIALISVGAAVFVILHAALLVPWNRYSLPMQPIWYLVTLAGASVLFRSGSPRSAACITSHSVRESLDGSGSGIDRVPNDHVS